MREGGGKRASIYWGSMSEEGISRSIVSVRAKQAKLNLYTMKVSYKNLHGGSA